MMEKKEYQGYFYTPESPEKQFSGYVHYFPNQKIRLELIGDFLSDEKIGSVSKQKFLKTIFGVIKTENGVSNVTLLNCYGSGGMSYNILQNCEIFITKYSCNYLLIGKHLEDIKDKVFNKIRVLLPYFNEWYRDNEIQFDCENDFTAIFKTINNHKNPLKIQLNKTETLILNGYSSHYDISNHEKCLYEDSYVEFESTNKSKLFDLLVNIGWFRDFYSFGAMSAMPFSEIYLYDYDDFHESRNKTSKINSIPEKVYNPVSLFYVAKEKLEEKDNFFHPNFLFQYQQIKDKLGVIMQAWYEKRENSEPIIQLLITSVTNSRFFKSSDFLTVIQAIEGYYNRFEKEDSLHNILTNLYQKYSDVKIVNKNKPNLTQVVDSRHYYSHLLPAGKKKNVCKDWDLYGLTEKLKPLLVGCILTEIGFQNQEINELLSNYYNWGTNNFFINH